MKDKFFKYADENFIISKNRMANLVQQSIERQEIAHVMQKKDNLESIYRNRQKDGNQAY